MSGALRYWEDFPAGGESVVGPVSVDAAEWDAARAALDLPASDSIPDEVVHSVAAGRVGEAGGFAAVACVRWAIYQPGAGLRAGEPFLVRSRVAASAAVDESAGTIELRREIVDARGAVRSRARLGVLLLRRPA